MMVEIKQINARILVPICITSVLKKKATHCTQHTEVQGVVEHLWSLTERVPQRQQADPQPRRPGRLGEGRGVPVPPLGVRVGEAGGPHRGGHVEQHRPRAVQPLRRKGRGGALKAGEAGENITPVSAMRQSV